MGDPSIKPNIGPQPTFSEAYLQSIEKSESSKSGAGPSGAPGGAGPSEVDQAAAAKAVSISSTAQTNLDNLVGRVFNEACRYELARVPLPQKQLQGRDLHLTPPNLKLTERQEALSQKKAVLVEAMVRSHPEEYLARDLTDKLKAVPKEAYVQGRGPGPGQDQELKNLLAKYTRLVDSSAAAIDNDAVFKEKSIEVDKCKESILQHIGKDLDPKNPKTEKLLEEANILLESYKMNTDAFVDNQCQRYDHVTYGSKEYTDISKFMTEVRDAETDVKGAGAEAQATSKELGGFSVTDLKAMLKEAKSLVADDCAKRVDILFQAPAHAIKDAKLNVLVNYAVGRLTLSNEAQEAAKTTIAAQPMPAKPKSASEAAELANIAQVQLIARSQQDVDVKASHSLVESRTITVQSKPLDPMARLPHPKPVDLDECNKNLVAHESRFQKLLEGFHHVMNDETLPHADKQAKFAALQHESVLVHAEGEACRNSLISFQEEAATNLEDFEKTQNRPTKTYEQAIADKREALKNDATIVQNKRLELLKSNDAAQQIAEGSSKEIIAQLSDKEILASIKGEAILPGGEKEAIEHRRAELLKTATLIAEYRRTHPDLANKASLQAVDYEDHLIIAYFTDEEINAAFTFEEMAAVAADKSGDASGKTGSVEEERARLNGIVQDLEERSTALEARLAILHESQVDTLDEASNIRNLQRDYMAKDISSWTNTFISHMDSLSSKTTQKWVNKSEGRTEKVTSNGKVEKVPLRREEHIELPIGKKPPGILKDWEPVADLAWRDKLTGKYAYAPEKPEGENWAELPFSEIENALDSKVDPMVNNALSSGDSALIEKLKNALEIRIGLEYPRLSDEQRAKFNEHIDTLQAQLDKLAAKRVVHAATKMEDAMAEQIRDRDEGWNPEIAELLMRLAEEQANAGRHGAVSSHMHHGTLEGTKEDMSRSIENERMESDLKRS